MEKKDFKISGQEIENEQNICKRNRENSFFHLLFFFRNYSSLTSNKLIFLKKMFINSMNDRFADCPSEEHGHQGADSYHFCLQDACHCAEATEQDSFGSSACQTEQSLQVRNNFLIHQSFWTQAKKCLLKSYRVNKSYYSASSFLSKRGSSLVSFNFHLFSKFFKPFLIKNGFSDQFPAWIL